MRCPALGHSYRAAVFLLSKVLSFAPGSERGKIGLKLSLRSCVLGLLLLSRFSHV